jgi:hypothetical protein
MFNMDYFDEGLNPMKSGCRKAPITKIKGLVVTLCIEEIMYCWQKMRLHSHQWAGYMEIGCIVH